MKQKTTNLKSRRFFLKNSMIASSGILVAPSLSLGAPAYLPNLKQNNATIEGVTLGLITYSFRALKEQSAEATLSYIKSCGINAVEMMGGPAESFAVNQSHLWIDVPTTVLFGKNEIKKLVQMKPKSSMK